jgi:magnesium transporter
VTDFTADTLREWTASEVAEVLPLRDSSTVSWIHVNGVHNTDLIRTLGEHFGIHPLVLEDIAHIEQRPKLEEYEDYLFLVLKMIYYDEDTDGLRLEHVSLILGPHCVISFQEDPGDVFDPVRERIRSARGRIRKLNVDYLAYALIDVIVDHYFVVLERFGETGEVIEDEILDEPSTDTQRKINDMRRQLIGMRRAVWPARELLGRLERLESPLIHEGTRPFIRDAYDHAVQVVDIVESLRDLVSGLTDLYMTAISNQMNEIMKVLTIIGTIFIPLTFVAGIYGMNFEYMPELSWQYGYFGVWIVMIVMAAVLLVFFRRREWI